MTFDPPGRGWRGPRVSVIVPAYNAARYLQQSIDSVLAQTFADFELIVVDDCSTDGTAAILAGYDDPRLRVVRNARNQGVVEARNRAWEHARGEYVAAFDADDVCQPTRLAKQVAFLDANPAVALVSAASLYLEDGAVLPDPGRRGVRPSPTVVRWMLHVSNPLVHPALMYRASVIRRLGVLLREEYKYAEDFDLYHRIMKTDEVALLDEPLILYRRHPGAITSKHEPEMIAAAARVLAGAYRPWFGPDADSAAALVAAHFLAGKAPADERELARLGGILSRLVEGFLATHEVGEDRGAILQHASDLWWWAMRSAVRSGRVRALTVAPPEFASGRRESFPRSDIPVSVASGLVPFKGALRSALRAVSGSAARPEPGRGRTTKLCGVEYAALPEDGERPPTLYVVVDAEAEFDWGKPFSSAHTTVEAMAAVGRGQAIFDRYGLRPIYVVDHPVASQPGGYRPLRAIHDRGGCEIGAHLHPWTNPPIEEELSIRNSYAGNLPPDLEERKLVALLDVIRRNFRFTPFVFKAGRYGVGPNTMGIIARHGIRLDLSIMPGRDFSRFGGPDFRDFDPTPRSLFDGRLVSVPMTRDSIGPLSHRFAGVAKHLDAGPLKPLRLPGALSRLGLLETVTLTPEGVPSDKQIALVRAMLARGWRSFVLHYHSPSLAPGFTPYARTPAEADEIVRRLDRVCRFFFETLGGVPGTVSNLLPPHLRRPGVPARERAEAADPVGGPDRAHGSGRGH